MIRLPRRRATHPNPDLPLALLATALRARAPAQALDVGVDAQGMTARYDDPGRRGHVTMHLRAPVIMHSRVSIRGVPEGGSLARDEVSIPQANLATVADVLMDALQRMNAKLPRRPKPSRPSPDPPSWDLPESERVAMNAALWARGLDGTVPQRSIGSALQVIGDVLHDHGYEWGTTLNSHLFLPDHGTRLLDIARSTPGDPFSPVSIENSAVSFSWHQFHTGRFEIIARLT